MTCWFGPIVALLFVPTTEPVEDDDEEGGEYQEEQVLAQDALCEVINLLSIRPLDRDAIINHSRHTG